MNVSLGDPAARYDPAVVLSPRASAPRYERTTDVARSSLVVAAGGAAGFEGNTSATGGAGVGVRRTGVDVATGRGLGVVAGAALAAGAADFGGVGVGRFAGAALGVAVGATVGVSVGAALGVLVGEIVAEIAGCGVSVGGTVA